MHEKKSMLEGVVLKKGKGYGLEQELDGVKWRLGGKECEQVLQLDEVKYYKSIKIRKNRKENKTRMKTKESNFDRFVLCNPFLFPLSLLFSFLSIDFFKVIFVFFYLSERGFESLGVGVGSGLG